jgi:hypothetical protein
MKIFISHSHVDVELVEPFDRLLKLGCCEPGDTIFCSSIKGTVPNGSYFISHILQQISHAELIILLLSPSFIQSQFCLAEAGVAQTRRVSKAAESYCLLIPPSSYADYDQGVLKAVQFGELLKEESLDELKDVLDRVRGNPSSAIRWTQAKADFLGNVASSIATRRARHQLEKIIV